MTVSGAIAKAQNNDWLAPIMAKADPCPRCQSTNLVRVECGDNCGTLSQVVCVDCALEGPPGRTAGQAVRLWNEAIDHAE